MPSGCSVIESTDQAATIMDPVRLRILALLRRPDSAASVARSLGLPRQRVGYHIRALQQAGLILSVGERRTSNYIEHLLQASAEFYAISPRALGPASATHAEPTTVRDRFSSDALITASSRTIAAVAFAPLRRVRLSVVEVLIGDGVSGLFPASRMTCGTCPIVVKKALEKVAGVSSITVDFDKKTATVTYDPDKASTARLAQATTEAGFPSRLIAQP